MSNRVLVRGGLAVGLVLGAAVAGAVVSGGIAPAGAAPYPGVPARGTVVTTEAGADLNRVIALPPGDIGRTDIGQGLGEPEGVAVDSAGDVFISDISPSRVVEVTPSGVQSVVVGAGLNQPLGLAIDANNNLYIADRQNHRVVKVAPDGTQTTIGSGLTSPQSLAVDALGNVYVAELNTAPIIKIAPNGAVTSFTVTGVDTPQSIAIDPAGDLYVLDFGTRDVVRVAPDGSQQPVATGTFRPIAVAADSAGDVYLGGENDQVVEVTSGGTQTTLATSGAGDPSEMVVDTAGDLFVADQSVVMKVPPGQLAQTTVFSTGDFNATAAAFDAAGDLYVTTGGYLGNLVKVTPDGTQTPIGSGIVEPYGVAVDASGDVYVGDVQNNDVVKIAPDGTQSTVPATGLSSPFGVAVDQAGNVYIADSDHARIVKVTPGGVQTTMLSGVSFPSGLAIDTAGNLYICDEGNNSILELTPSGAQRTVVSNVRVNGVAVDRSGVVYVAEGDDGVLEVATNGSETFHGTGVNNSFGVAVYDPPTNHPPVASDASRTVPAGTTSNITLSASDPDGDALTYSVTSGPSHGTLTGSAPDLDYTPATGYAGADSIMYSVADGKGGTASGTVSITVSASGASSVSQSVSAGQTVATGTTPTADTPVQAGVTSPDAGTVTITSDPSIADPSGYAVVGTQYQIAAPQASVAAPLSVSFVVSAASLPAGVDSNSLTVFRDGVAIGACADSSGTATPDPCVASRSQNGDAITIVVLSSHASQWTIAVPIQPTAISIAPVTTVSYGHTSALSATVVVTGSAVPSGSVTFTDTTISPAVVLGSAPIGAGGTATLNVSLAAGSHSIVANYAGTVDTASATSATATVVVSRQTVTISALSSSQVYGASAPSITYAVNGLVNGDKLTIGPNCTVLVTHRNVGSYPITCSGANAGPNYSISYPVGGSLSVTPARLTITASSASTAFGAAPPKITPTITGLVNGDTAAVLGTKLTCIANTQTTTPPATYVLTSTCSGAVDRNYAITYVSGTITVTKAPTKLVAANEGLVATSVKATLTSAVTGAPIAGQVITFTAGSKTICTGTTNQSGVAACSILGVSLKGTYTASYAAHPDYLASTSTAKL